MPEKYRNKDKNSFAHKYGELYLEGCINFQQEKGYIQKEITPVNAGVLFW